MAGRDAVDYTGKVLSTVKNRQLFYNMRNVISKWHWLDTFETPHPHTPHHPSTAVSRQPVRLTHACSRVAAPDNQELIAQKTAAIFNAVRGSEAQGAACLPASRAGLVVSTQRSGATLLGVALRILQACWRCLPTLPPPPLTLPSPHAPPPVPR